MMKRLIMRVGGVLVMLLASGVAQAELQLFDDFEAGSADDSVASGVLGGFRDSESNNTGNVALETAAQGNPTQSYRIEGNSSGDERGFTVTGVDNPIVEGETGLLFFRFVHRADGRRGYDWVGITNLDMTSGGDNALNSGNENDADAYIVAGFLCVRNSTTGADPISVVRLHDLEGTDTTIDEELTTLTPGVWYDVWIEADNATDTFNLYIQESTDVGGLPPAQPTSDPILVNEPFNIPGTDALRGLAHEAPDDPPRPWADRNIRLYFDDIWWDGDQGLSAPVQARNPSPADGTSDVPRDVVLGWEATPSAAAHDVYFDTSLDDVATADAANPLGALVSQGQDANTYDPDGLLSFGKTYYWRVDEVNAPPDNTIVKGDVWSFTAEPFAYPVADVTATASIPTSLGAGEPARTADGSGLDGAGLHSIADADMWLGDATAGGPIWIQYDFDQVYRLHDMHVWNYNTLYEPFVGFGVKDVTIEYALDANDWVVLGDYEIARAPGLADYAGMTIDLGGIAAQSVRINVSSNWGTEQKHGLGEVLFSYIPVHAREPEPASGAADLEPAVVLSWRAGREAALHQVSFDTDQDAVANDAAVGDTVATNTYDPGSLNLGTTYYWKIDEVNEAEAPSVWPSDVWSFTTKEYIVIDDFDSYTDDPGNRIYETWIDGYENTMNGSLVGHENPPYAERTIRRAGQSMPFYYANTGGVANSEAELTLSPAQDWSANGADTLSLWFRGVPTGFTEPSAGSIVMNGTGNDIWSTADQGRFVYKRLTGNGMIVARVEYLDATDPWAKAGVMIRQMLTPESSWALALASAANGVHFQARLTNAASAVSDTSLTLPEEQTMAAVPVWIKLERIGNQFNVYYATDEVPTAWIANPWNPQTVEMADPVYIGLAVTSHNTSAVAQAAFSGIATTGNVTGAWQSASLGVDQPEGNGLDTLYLAVEGSSGRKATLVNPNPYAVGTGVWTQWLIPLSDLAASNVNVESVSKLYLGVGDAAKPSQNAAGVLYIDDVAYGHPISTP